MDDSNVYYENIYGLDYKDCVEWVIFYGLVETQSSVPQVWIS